MNTLEWTLKEIKNKRLLYMKAFHYKIDDQRILLEYELNMLNEVLKSLEDENDCQGL